MISVDWGKKASEGFCNYWDIPDPVSPLPFSVALFDPTVTPSSATLVRLLDTETDRFAQL